MQQLPITEKEISAWTTAPVFSPILCANLSYLGLDTTSFIDFFKDSFIKMPWDFYDVKRKQWELLPKAIQTAHFETFKQYYLDSAANVEQFTTSLNLEESTKKELIAIQPWRRRSVCGFELIIGKNIQIERVYSEGFEQALEEADIRSLPRVFEETDGALVETPLFYDFLKKVAQKGGSS